MIIKKIFSIFILVLLFFNAVLLVEARTLRPSDIQTPNGYKIEPVVENLSSPTMVAFDNQGRMLIAESGYDQGGEPKVARIEKDGKKTVLVHGAAFGNELPVTSVAFYNNQIYVVHAGTVSIVEFGNKLKNIITGLPGQGDHQANQLVFKNGQMYLSIGTVTNAGVVGPDNAVFGWLKKTELRTSLHEVPCENITLSETASFQSNDVSGQELPEVRTSAYAPFGTDLGAGAVIEGKTKCNGAVLRANPDGSDLEVFAWGFRNPYGLEIGPDNDLYVTVHGFDARGSRPIENAWDCAYKVTEGAWYGWPDFACDVSVTDPRFKTEDKPQPQFLIANHPTESPPKPIVKFPPHAATNGFAFAQEGWGKSTDIFIALFGDFTPATGTVKEPQGVKIVKVDTTNGKIEDFIVNKVPGQASRFSGGGLEHPSDVTYGPDGAMYIADWGIARVSDQGLKLDKNSGVIWRVSRDSSYVDIPGGFSVYMNIFLMLFLAGLTYILLRGNDIKKKDYKAGAMAGLFAGLAMGITTIIISRFILELPWYAPPRVLATLVTGSSALSNILEFELSSFIVGLAVLEVLAVVLGLLFIMIRGARNKNHTIIGGLFFGLAVWALLQYFLFPAVDPLITEKGFPPFWYAISFAVYGLTLGWLTVKSNN